MNAFQSIFIAATILLTSVSAGGAGGKVIGNLFKGKNLGDGIGNGAQVGGLGSPSGKVSV